MERRLIIAFDCGCAGEMLTIRSTDVKLRIRYEITLQPHQTKGGKSSGKTERACPDAAGCDDDPGAALSVAREQGRAPIPLRHRGRTSTERLQARVAMICSRSPSLDFGRDKGLVFHTVRHEFISRLVEQKVDPVVIMKSRDISR